jgi:hypothetical protein
MKKMFLFGVCLALVGACASEDQAEVSSENIPHEQLFSSEEVGKVPDVELVKGEDGESGDFSTKAGCSHIQWCNEPGPNGTICIWDACSYSAAYNECVVDANYVCGGIKQPAYIR